MFKNSKIRIIYRICIAIIIVILGLYLSQAIYTKYGNSNSILFEYIIFILSLLIGFLYNKRKKDYRILLGVAFFMIVNVLLYLIPSLYYWIYYIFK